MLCAPEAEHTLLGSRLLFVAPRAADGCVIAALVQRLLQRLRLHHVGVHGGAVADRPDALRHAILVDVHREGAAGFLGAPVAEGDHLAELPGGVHVQQRDRWAPGRKRLDQQVQQHRAVLADGVQHHRVAELGRDLAQDVDALGLKAVEMAQIRGRHDGSWGACEAADYRRFDISGDFGHMSGLVGPLLRALSSSGSSCPRRQASGDLNSGHPREGGDPALAVRRYEGQELSLSLRASELLFFACPKKQ